MLYRLKLPDYNLHIALVPLPLPSTFYYSPLESKLLMKTYLLYLSSTIPLPSS